MYNEVEGQTTNLAIWRLLKPLNQEAKEEETTGRGKRKLGCCLQRVRNPGGSSGHLLALLSLLVQVHEKPQQSKERWDHQEFRQSGEEF